MMPAKPTWFFVNTHNCPFEPKHNKPFSSFYRENKGRLYSHDLQGLNKHHVLLLACILGGSIPSLGEVGVSSHRPESTV